MIAVVCGLTGMRQLLSLSQVLTVHNGPDGPVAIYRCGCGAIDRWPTDRRLSDDTTIEHPGLVPGSVTTR